MLSHHARQPLTFMLLHVKTFDAQVQLHIVQSPQVTTLSAVPTPVQLCSNCEFHTAGLSEPLLGSGAPPAAAVANSLWGDICTLCRHPVFLYNCIGYCPIQGAFGVYSYFGPQVSVLIPPEQVGSVLLHRLSCMHATSHWNAFLLYSVLTQRHEHCEARLVPIPGSKHRLLCHWSGLLP